MTACILIERYEGGVDVLDRAFGHVEMGDLENSTFALDFGHRRLALLFELVEGRNHDEGGVS